MNDFLGNLAAKSLNLMPVIQPRPVSLFEPWQAGGALASQLRTDRDERAIPMSFDQAEPDRAPVARQIDRIVQHRPEIPPHEQATLRFQPHAINESQPLDPRATPRSIWEAPRTPAEHDSHRRADENDDTSRLMRDQSALKQNNDRQEASHAKPNAVLGIGHDQVEPKHPTPPQSVRGSNGPSSSEMPEAKANPRPLMMPIVERVVTERDRSGQQPKMTPEVVLPYQPAAVSPRIEHASPTMPPTIHVTIGRIEVRATSATAPAKRTPRSSSATSLEEYLRSRSGGKR